MEELFKNPLMGQSDGISAKNGVYFDVPLDIQNTPNPLAINLNNADIKNSPFAENPLKKEDKKPEIVKKPVESETSKKRLNDLDFNILQDSAVKKAQGEFSGNNAFSKFLYKYFPKIYKSILVRRGLNKLIALNETAGELINLKTIPYGESDERYNALIEYLSSANSIHAKLIKKI